MRIAFAVVIGLHGLIHLLGAAKGFGWAAVPQLRTPISPGGGALWLLTAILLVGTATSVALGVQRWWWLGLPALLLSQTLVVMTWSDAKFGTLANIVLAIPLLLLAVDRRPSSFRSQFARDRDALLARPVQSAPLVSEADLVTLPPLMRRRGRAATRAQHAGALRRADAKQRHHRMDACNRGAIRVLRSARTPVLHERHAWWCTDRRAASLRR